MKSLLIIALIPIWLCGCQSPPLNTNQVELRAINATPPMPRSINPLDYAGQSAMSASIPPTTALPGSRIAVLKLDASADKRPWAGKRWVIDQSHELPPTWVRIADVPAMTGGIVWITNMLDYADHSFYRVGWTQ